jgi:hypothetical protein
VAPEKEGGCVEGEALQEILHVDGHIGSRVVRDEVECLGRHLVEDVKVGHVILYEEWVGNLAALDTNKKGGGMSE